MLKKTNTSNSQIVTDDTKKSKIPSDFEPVARDKQDEEHDFMFKSMAKGANFAAQRVSDDMEDDDEDYHEHDKVDKEEVLHVDDSKQATE